MSERILTPYDDDGNVRILGKPRGAIKVVLEALNNLGPYERVTTSQLAKRTGYKVHSLQLLMSHPWLKPFKGPKKFQQEIVWSKP